MTTLAELVFNGGGLEGASEKQVRAVLEKLQTFAVVVEHRSLPTASFVISNDEPAVVFLGDDGGGNSSTNFTDRHLSASRSLTAVREAMSVHVAITSAEVPQKARYAAARELFLRRRVERESVSQGGAQGLSSGAL